MVRSAEIERKTNETDIRIRLNIDGKGEADIRTGVPFLDHMLILMTAHGFFDLAIRASGDTEVDDHHTVEDIGIVLGDSFKKAVCDKTGIKRYGRAVIPMDEALASVVIDLCDRPCLVYNLPMKQEKIGRFDVELVQEFFRGFTNHLGATIHINVMYGENMHHIIEAVFKALGRALDEATTLDPRIKKVLSTKGLL
ncbi:MAG: imidazoleglycerol-phosphate dehydratase [Desulfobacterales bacterium C00003106]|jgi:imidazoleglycerol-phosphate dehydratase|nr:imidazoleglycerol-phosphate dehydratase HisB [Deltaproteobacteria bacterium]OEU53069.1 MAG: imidazoleglycerol-phosphate dehydratase [Desulfobacterales bacterium C00003106]OEU57429.1 MAG: imidazoleglycerol-phosphate dehydratase [Desulfobacterales bacterium C00003104]